MKQNILPNRKVTVFSRLICWRTLTVALLSFTLLHEAREAPAQSSSSNRSYATAKRYQRVSSRRSRKRSRRRTRSVATRRTEFVPVIVGTTDPVGAGVGDNNSSTTPNANSNPNREKINSTLNGRAISLPQPPYPSVARAARASGKVIVYVTVDQSGKVIEAEAIAGHPLLREAAVKAAYKAVFLPTLLGGRPVKVAGTITYNFVLK